MQYDSNYLIIFHYKRISVLVRQVYVVIPTVKVY